MAKLKAMGDWPKYIVFWQTDFDVAGMTPQQAAVEALRAMKDELQAGNAKVDVVETATDRRWVIGFHEHVLEVIECGKRPVQAVVDWDPT